MIIETVVTTVSPSGTVHVAPMGIREEADRLLLRPFRPSTTLDNLIETKAGVVNLTDDVRLFAGCITGRRNWPTRALSGTPARHRLCAALTHRELAVERIDDDSERPSLWCRVTASVSHAPFPGFNRAQAAVIEAAILVSRVHLLPREKIEREMGYLGSAIDKTAGAREREAWQWLIEALERSATR